MNIPTSTKRITGRTKSRGRHSRRALWARKALAIFLSVVMVVGLTPTASCAEAADELSAATATTQGTAATTQSDASSSAAATETQPSSSSSASATDASSSTATDGATTTAADAGTSSQPAEPAESTTAAPGYPTDDASVRTASLETKDPASNPTTVSAAQSGLSLITAATWNDDTHANDNWSAVDTLTVSGIAAARQALVESGKEATSSQVSLRVILSKDYVLDDASLKSSFEADKTALAANGIDV